MASERNSENPAEPVAGTLEAELLKALRRLLAYEGSIAAVARIIGIPRQRLSRWYASARIPREVLADDAVLQRILWNVYARFAVLDRDQPAREARDRQMAKNAAAEELLRRFGNARERKKLLSDLRGWVKRHGEVARLRGLRESGVVRFAAELGVRADLVRQALAPGRESPSVKLFQAYEEFLAREREQAIEDELRRRKMDRLMDLARVPKKVKRQVQRWRKVREGGRLVRRRVMVWEDFEEPVLPKVPPGNWDFSGEGTAGRRWGYPVGKYLLPRLHPSGKDGWAVVEAMVRFALAVPGLTPAARYPEWKVDAIASAYGENHDGSGQQYRQLGDERENREFTVSEVYSGGNRRGPRARERTISSEEVIDAEKGVVKRGMVQRIGDALDGDNVIFVHGAIAWNFRRRTEEERRRIEKKRREDRDFQKTLAEIAARVEAASKAKKAKRARRAARKKTLAAVLAHRAAKKSAKKSAKKRSTSSKRKAGKKR